MALFGDRDTERRRSGQMQSADLLRDAKLREELSALVALGKRSEVDRAINEAERVADEATRADIRGIKLMELGRCPECSARTENFLYTAVCPSCGWYRRSTPASEQCVVTMDSGEEIHCDHIFSVHGDQILCVRDGVVTNQVARRYVRRVDYIWEEGELEAARQRTRKEREGVCSWCDKSLREAEADGPFDEYVAFGAMQEHYVFCSKPCLVAFRKQYPPRVHRNCYETECAVCDQCIKRFDVDGYKRVMLP